MKLVPQWRRLLRKAWSLRLAALSISLSAVEASLPYIAPQVPSGKFALLSIFFGIAAAVARLVWQESLHDGE